MPFVGKISSEVIFLSDQSADESVLLKTVLALGRVPQVAKESWLEPNLSKVPWSARARMVPLSAFLFVFRSRVMNGVGVNADRIESSMILPEVLLMHAWMKNAWL